MTHFVEVFNNYPGACNTFSTSSISCTITTIKYIHKKEAIIMSWAYNFSCLKHPAANTIKPDGKPFAIDPKKGFDLR